MLTHDRPDISRVMTLLLDQSLPLEEILVQLNISASALADWTHNEKVHTSITSLTHLWNLRADLLAAQARAEAMLTLIELARPSTRHDPELTRRAATTILRHKPRAFPPSEPRPPGSGPAQPPAPPVPPTTSPTSGPSTTSPTVRQSPPPPSEPRPSGPVPAPSSNPPSFQEGVGGRFFDHPAHTPAHEHTPEHKLESMPPFGGSHHPSLLPVPSRDRRLCRSRDGPASGVQAASGTGSSACQCSGSSTTKTLHPGGKTGQRHPTRQRSVVRTGRGPRP